MNRYTPRETQELCQSRGQHACIAKRITPKDSTAHSLIFKGRVFSTFLFFFPLKFLLLFFLPRDQLIFKN